METLQRNVIEAMPTGDSMQCCVYTIAEEAGQRAAGTYYAPHAGDLRNYSDAPYTDASGVWILRWQPDDAEEAAHWLAKWDTDKHSGYTDDGSDTCHEWELYDILFIDECLEVHLTIQSVPN